jgi:hypothetical protein
MSIECPPYLNECGDCMGGYREKEKSTKRKIN